MIQLINNLLKASIISILFLNMIYNINLFIITNLILSNIEPSIRMLPSKKDILIGLLCVLIATFSFSLTKNGLKNQNQQTLKSQKTINQIKGNELKQISISVGENLQFSNYTGTAITSDMVSNYIKIINNAYSFFGSNLNSTTYYISKQLQESYGWAYSVSILKINQPTYSWTIYNIGNSVVVWSQVNTYQANWTYIIWPLPTYNFQTTNYIGGLGRGIGVDTPKETVIRNIVKAQQDKYSSCNCYQSDISQMGNKLKQFDGQSWTIICKRFTSISFNSLLKTNNNQYIQLFVSTGKCEYLFAVA